MERRGDALKIVVLGEGKKPSIYSTAQGLVSRCKTRDPTRRLEVSGWKSKSYKRQNVTRVLKEGFLLNHHESNPNCCLARVGKTSISLRFVNGVFDKDQMSTVDASFLEKKVNVGEKTVKLNIWDTAGQEKYHALAKNYY